MSEKRTFAVALQADESIANVAAYQLGQVRRFVFRHANIFPPEHNECQLVCSEGNRLAFMLNALHETGSGTNDIPGVFNMLQIQREYGEQSRFNSNLFINRYSSLYPRDYLYDTCSNNKYVNTLAVQKIYGPFHTYRSYEDFVRFSARNGIKTSIDAILTPEHSRLKAF